jgi:BlaI family transcriptional regulator, penicillinase repressor
MARPPAELLTDRETQIMGVLWSRGPSTSEAVRQALPDRPHDSTIRTLLRILKNKGYVHIRGRQPALYEPAIPRSLVQTKATKSLLSRLFGGSVEDLVLRLLEDETLSPEQLDQLRKQIRRQRKGDK